MEPVPCNITDIKAACVTLGKGVRGTAAVTVYVPLTRRIFSVFVTSPVTEDLGRGIAVRTAARIPVAAFRIFAKASAFIIVVKRKIFVCQENFLRLFYLPQHCLYFLPLPQGQGSFLPTFVPFVTGFFFCSSLPPPEAVTAVATCCLLTSSSLGSL